eukprot:GHVH01006146.1.p2 GENE.GHVH01006146.1~~GHVH01006146.1.p2  ORF type:complete len:135 (+),score=21.34 GHVH01006146.1:1044-1448(+)
MRVQPSPYHQTVAFASMPFTKFKKTSFVSGVCLVGVGIWMTLDRDDFEQSFDKFTEMLTPKEKDEPVQRRGSTMRQKMKMKQKRGQHFDLDQIDDPPCNDFTDYDRHKNDLIGQPPSEEAPKQKRQPMKRNVCE